MKGSFKIILLFVLSIILGSSVNAAVIGVSPSIVRYSQMTRDGYAERTVTITTSSSAPVAAKLVPEGEIADWISFEPGNTEFIFTRERPHAFKMVVRPPGDAQSGNYSGLLKVTTTELESLDQGSSSSIIAQVALLIYIEVSDDEIIACSAGAIGVNSAEIGDELFVRATVQNEGNVRFRPEVVVDIWDQYETEIIFSSSFRGDQILPTTSREVLKGINNNLEIGQYFADITVSECDVSKRMSFDILREGEIADAGQFVGIKTNEIGYIDEPHPIVPVFRNNGIRKVIAQFKGELRNLRNDKVIGVIESDQLEVNPGETKEFSMFFIPENKGDFSITGRVVYNNKVTQSSQSKTIKILGTTNSRSWLFFIFGYLVIGLTILILITKIRKAKKKKRKF